MKDITSKQFNCLLSDEADVYFHRPGYDQADLLFETMFRYLIIKHLKDFDGRWLSTKVLDDFHFDIRRNPRNGYETIFQTANKYKLTFAFSNHHFSKAIYTDFIPSNWNKLEDFPYPVNRFLSNIVPTVIYKNTDGHVVILRGNIKSADTEEKYDAALSSILIRVIPSLLGENYTPDDEEIELSKSLAARDYSKIANIVKQYVSSANINFRDLKIRKMLDGYSKDIVNAKIKELNIRVSNLRQDIEMEEKRLCGYYNLLSDYMRDLNAYDNYIPTLNNSDDDFVKFFIDRKNIIPVEISSSGDGKCLLYTVVDTLEYWDTELAKSVLWRVPDDMKPIFKGLFVDRIGVLRVQASFKLDNLSSLRATRTTLTAYEGTHIPNPHIHHYTCMGGNTVEILQLIEEGLWDMAIEQTIACTKNINFADTTVANHFIIDLRGAFSTDSVKKYVLVDGQEMTLNEYSKYLQQKNEVTTNGN